MNQAINHPVILSKINKLGKKFCEKENKIDKDDETEETKNQVIIT